jgi:hypothetical protein
VKPSLLRLMLWLEKVDIVLDVYKLLDWSLLGRPFRTAARKTLKKSRPSSVSWRESGRVSGYGWFSSGLDFLS